MSFEAIPEGQTRDDALNGSYTALIGRERFIKETAAWQELHQLGRATVTMVEEFSMVVEVARRLQVRAGQQLAGTRITAEGIVDAQGSVAILAMSRLMRAVVPYWAVYDDLDIEKEPDSRNKQIVDMVSGQLLDNAHGLLVHRDKLAGPPFEYTNLPQSGEQWFVDRQEGLYVAARTPAEVSPGFRQQMTPAVGGQAALDAMIDARNSVTLLPYLSYRGLLGERV